MRDELSPAGRAHRFFRHFTRAGLSGILKPELVEDAAREFGSPKSRRRTLTLPVIVWLGLHMALGYSRSPALPAPNQPVSRDGGWAGRQATGTGITVGRGAAAGPRCRAVVIEALVSAWSELRALVASGLPLSPVTRSAYTQARLTGARSGRAFARAGSSQASSTRPSGRGRMSSRHTRTGGR